MLNTKKKIGFIGQGYIGKNYSDDLEKRGFSVTRYANEEPHNSNKGLIKDCDIVFIAVPTPTTPKGFDDSVVSSVISLVGKGKTAVIKSTVIPGTTKKLQKLYPGIIVLISPEFLSEKTAAQDAAHPFSNIVGIPVDDNAHKEAATAVHEILPKSPFVLTCDSDEAEIIKYTHNASGYIQIILFNLMYDLAQKMGHGWSNIEKAIKADPLVCNRYANPVHQGGRGAGGHCFIKDLAAIKDVYNKLLPGDKLGSDFLEAAARKNISLLLSSGKDLDLLKGVYGEEASKFVS